MATITISPKEIINILIANDILPKDKLSTQDNDNDINVKLKLGFISVGIVIKLLSYEKDIAEFEIKANKLVENELFKKLKEYQSEQNGLQLDPPTIRININKLLKPKINGLKIEDLVYKKGNFHINAESY